jgi:hypothetical protein
MNIYIRLPQTKIRLLEWGIIFDDSHHRPTALNFSLINSSGFTGSFSAASPIPSGGYLIIRKEGSAVTDVPVDGIAYSSGTLIGASTIAGIGASTAFTEVSLNAATVYYYKIFSFGKGSDPSTVNYYTSGTPLVNNQVTLAASPTLQATGITYTGITNSQITLTWINGNGTRRIVLAHEGAMINSNPIAANGYTAGAVFGSGTNLGTGNFVVYDGPENAVVVTGLGAGYTYYFEVFEYNGVGATANYLNSTNSSNPSLQITVPPIPVIENASNEKPSNFIANWLTAHGASSYELDVSLKSSGFVTFVNNYNAFALRDSTQNQQLVTGLTSNTIYQYRLRARNAAGVSGNSAPKIVLTSDGTVLAPTIAVTSSTASTILVQTSNGFNPSTNSITFLHRKIKGTVFTAEPDVKGSSTSISINTQWFDQLGMEYYIKVTDEANIKDSTASQFSYTILSNINLSDKSNFEAGGSFQSYRIFSIPMQLPSNRIEDIFQQIEAQYAGASKTKWRLVHYQKGQNVDYGAGLTSIEQGKSYWFNSIEAPKPITLSGSVTQANQGQEFILSLDAGFTQIGNPYPFPISWNDVLSKNANVPGIANVGSLYTYDAVHASFIKDSSQLQAWSGGFVHSNSAIQLAIPVITAGSTSGRKRNEKLNSSIDASQWYVPININQGLSSNTYSGIGMSPESKIGYDRFDDFTPPRFVNYLELNSPHPDYLTPKFCKDMVTTAKQYNWSFEVESNLGRAISRFKLGQQSIGQQRS